MDCCDCVQGSKMFKDLCKSLCHYEFHTLDGVTKFCVVFVLYFLYIIGLHIKVGHCRLVLVGLCGQGAV